MESIPSTLFVGIAVAVFGFGLAQAARAWRRMGERAEQGADDLKQLIKELSEETREALRDIQGQLRTMNGRLGRQEQWATSHDKRDDETHNDAKERLRRLETKVFT